jgi:lysophospholipase L1-like esterase
MIMVFLAGISLLCFGLLKSHIKLANAAANTYTQIFSDNFNRPDTTAADLANGWQQPRGTNWQILNNTLSVYGETTTSPFYEHPLVRPNLLKNGKATATFNVVAGTSSSADAGVYPLIARYDDSSTAFYMVYAYFNLGGSRVTLRGCPMTIGVSDCGPYNTSHPESMLVSTNMNDTAVAGSMTLEMTVNSISASSTEVTGTLYDSSGNVLKLADGVTPLTISFTDSTANVQSAGQWGMNTFATITEFTNYALYQTDAPAIDMTIGTNVKNIKLGNNVAVTVTDDEAKTVTLSDGDAGGTFNPAQVTLNAGNSFTANSTYTPARAGRTTLSATSGFDGAETQVVISPYSTTIGFIGDSITDSTNCTSPCIKAANVQANTLGSGISVVNRGVSGSATGDWVSSLLNPSIASFQSAGVEVVQIMLGTNDASIIKGHVPATTFKVNLQTIISQLKSAGMKRIILQRPPYFIIPTSNRDQASLDLMSEYYTVLRELVDGETVFLGDRDAWDWFKNNPSRLPDNTHPDTAGYAKLGELWAAAYDRIIIDPLTTDHGFVGGSNYQPKSGNTLTHFTAKDYTWFASGYFAGILIDGSLLDPNYYSSSDGSTKIILSSAYLDTLAEGDYTLTVRFTDGVNFSDSFSVLPATTEPEVPSTGLFSKLSDGGDLTTISIVAVAIGATVAAVIYIVVRNRRSIKL